MARVWCYIKRKSAEFVAGKVTYFVENDVYGDTTDRPFLPGGHSETVTVDQVIAA
jgi:hypothetical protein